VRRSSAVRAEAPPAVANSRARRRRLNTQCGNPLPDPPPTPQSPTPDPPKAHRAWHSYRASDVCLSARLDPRTHVSLVCPRDDHVLKQRAGPQAAGKQGARDRQANEVKFLESLGMTEEQLLDGVVQFFEDHGVRAVNAVACCACCACCASWGCCAGCAGWGCCECCACCVCAWRWQGLRAGLDFCLVDVRGMRTDSHQ